MKKTILLCLLPLFSVSLLTAQPGTPKFNAGNFLFVANYALSDSARMQLPPTSILAVRNDTMQINLPYAASKAGESASRILQWTTADYKSKARSLRAEGTVVEMDVSAPGGEEKYTFTLKTSPASSRAQLVIEAPDSTTTSYTGFVR